MGRVSARSALRKLTALLLCAALLPLSGCRRQAAVDAEETSVRSGRGTSVRSTGTTQTTEPTEPTEPAGEPAAKRIALTFDDGPSKRYTAKILDILKAHGVKATFFVVGENVQKFPDLLSREIAEGHEIGNHTYSHCHLQKIDADTLSGELDKAGKLLMQVGGYKTTLFRPPEGVVNRAVKTAAEGSGYSLVLWTIDTRDWAHNTPERIVANITKNASDGDIILFHDFVVGDSPTPGVLEVIIPKLREMGFEFVTVSELSEPKI